MKYSGEEKNRSTKVLSAKYMANGDSKVITIIGAGVQGRSVARYLDHALKLEEIRVIDVKPQAADKFKKERNIAVLTGTGDLDAAVAKYIFDKSNQFGIGTYIDL